MIEALAADQLVDAIGMPARHRKGYVWLYLGRGHPYANSGGCQYLHRYLMMRELRRRLLPSEHVHHVDGAPKDTTDVSRLAVMIDTEHGSYHWHWHHKCRCKADGRTLEAIEADAQSHADEYGELPTGDF